MTTTALYWRLEQVDPSSDTSSASILIRQLIAATGLCEWRGVVRDASGRPRLVGAPQLDVSISRSGHWYLVSLAHRLRVGADIEEVTPVFDQPVLMRRACTSRETRTLLAAVPERRREALADLWTVKEALLKCHGVGLRLDPRTVHSQEVRHLRLREARTGVSAALVIATAS